MTTPTPLRSDSGTPRQYRYPDVYCKNARFRRASRGFTLVEILVTISIIALLAGLVTVGALAAQRGAQRSRTKSSMTALLGAVEQYKTKFAVPPAHNVAVPGGLTSSEALVWACNSDDTLRELLVAAMQGRGVFKDKDGDSYEELYDPWDNPILYRAVNNQAGASPDPGVNNNQLPVHAFPFFVSAGPDGEYGTDDDITSLEIGS